jgi:hypothetical protein
VKSTDSAMIGGERRSVDGGVFFAERAKGVLSGWDDGMQCGVR